MAGSVAATKYDSGGRSRVGNQGAIAGASEGKKYGRCVKPRMLCLDMQRNPRWGVLAVSSPQYYISSKCILKSDDQGILTLGSSQTLSCEFIPGN